MVKREAGENERVRALIKPRVPLLNESVNLGTNSILNCITKIVRIFVVLLNLAPDHVSLVAE